MTKAQLSTGREGGVSSLFLLIAARGQPAQLLFLEGSFVSCISIALYFIWVNSSIELLINFSDIGTVS